VEVEGQPDGLVGHDRARELLLDLLMRQSLAETETLLEELLRARLEGIEQEWDPLHLDRYDVLLPVPRERRVELELADAAPRADEILDELYLHVLRLPATTAARRHAGGVNHFRQGSVGRVSTFATQMPPYC